MGTLLHFREGKRRVFVRKVLENTEGPALVITGCSPSQNGRVEPVIMTHDLSDEQIISIMEAAISYFRSHNASDD